MVPTGGFWRAVQGGAYGCGGGDNRGWPGFGFGVSG
jgi:hypothetical protein